MLDAVVISFAVIFVAELGDKSQLMALAFAARYRMTPILTGITAATALVHALSVLLGLALHRAIPAGWITMVAAVAFFAFSVWTWRGDTLSERESNRIAATAGSAILVSAIAFFLAELGDKTMLATVTLATQHGPFGTWLGSTLGMVVADALAIIVGRLLGRRLPDRIIRLGAAAGFALFGIVLAVQALSLLTSHH